MMIWLIISARCNERVQLFSMRIEIAFRSIIFIFSFKSLGKRSKVFAAKVNANEIVGEM